jgi:hypothetical protein
MKPASVDDDDILFPAETVFGAELPKEIEDRITDLLGGKRKYEVVKQILNGAENRVTFYFTDQRYISASVIYNKMSPCKGYAGAKIVIKNEIVTDSIADNKTKSRMEFLYSQTRSSNRYQPIKVNRGKSPDIVLEYSDALPSELRTTAVAGGLELIAHALEMNLGGEQCVDSEGNQCKRKYKVFPVSAVIPNANPAVVDNTYLVHVKNLTTEFFYDAYRDTMKTIAPEFEKYGLSPTQNGMLVWDSNLYVFVMRVEKKETRATERGRGNGLMPKKSERLRT